MLLMMGHSLNPLRNLDQLGLQAKSREKQYIYEQKGTELQPGSSTVHAWKNPSGSTYFALQSFADLFMKRKI